MKPITGLSREAWERIFKELDSAVFESKTSEEYDYAIGFMRIQEAVNKEIELAVRGRKK